MSERRDAARSRAAAFKAAVSSERRDAAVAQGNLNVDGFIPEEPYVAEPYTHPRAMRSSFSPVYEPETPEQLAAAHGVLTTRVLVRDIAPGTPEYSHYAHILGIESIQQPLFAANLHVCSHWDERKTHACECPISTDHYEKDLI